MRNRSLSKVTRDRIFQRQQNLMLQSRNGEDATLSMQNHHDNSIEELDASSHVSIEARKYGGSGATKKMMENNQHV